MYFVDRNKIVTTLQHLDELIQIFQGKNDWSENDITKLALQRIAHNSIEALMDVGNLMIDGFIMRDPGSYDDIIDILVDEKVITPDMELQLKEVVALRKMIVREYVDIDNTLIQTVLANCVPSLSQFSSHVLNYLENELGPVSAFLPENEK
nr:DUF86 domain-containing protein [Lysinibacillus timonensis]